MQLINRERAMDWKLILTTFGTIFLAELGDKTQLATLLYATQVKNPWMVFVGAASALVLTSLLAVLLGDAVTRFIPPRAMRLAAGIGFIVVGGWVILSAFQKGIPKL